MGFFSKPSKRVGDPVTINKISSLHGESEGTMKLGEDIDIDTFREYSDRKGVVYVSEVYEGGEPKSYFMQKKAWQDLRAKFRKIDSNL
jgi:hypothetical protein